MDQDQPATVAMQVLYDTAAAAAAGIDTASFASQMRYEIQTSVIYVSSSHY